MVASASDEGIFHGKCLEQSMVLWWLLKRQQLPAELQLGGRRTNTGFEAHAWVEVEGNVINDHDTVGQDFAPFSSDADSLRAEPR
jgi:Transglutaminase-like superfamily